ncbi:hypothetical protein MAR_002864 [Mya arenaria]|uniref:Uncharacterized protein n=1 Tax=Mya arenaria TaxID=6604 RepID=A0ABY7G8D1_MYAAR|nr:hypothetical protein MAR_002864 [Mya arenaria]
MSFAFKSFEEPLYEELALKQLPDKSLPPGIPRWFKMAKNKRSTESVRSSSKGVVSVAMKTRKRDLLQQKK